ncbi:type VII secretion target [Kitasatospora sp. NPDC093558]|uniref:WXG100 family type VII secretion target n=1 Tax=Kitasatospora sp. NPDC093558 TaxID=3155201 RepID=UPI00341DDA0E
MPNPDLAADFKVNPAALEGCGQSAQFIASQIPTETAKLTEPCNQAAAGLQGWQTATALQSCSTNWKTLLDKLGKDMGDLGSKLVQTAGVYRQGEQSVYAHLQGQGRGTPVPAEPDPFGTMVVGETSTAAEKSRAASERKAK